MRIRSTLCPFQTHLSVRLIATFTFLLVALLLTPAKGMTDIYQLGQTTGSPTDMTGSTQIYGANASYTSSTSTYPIGFTFYFDKQPYTTFSPNASGLMSLGRATYLYPYSHYWPNLSTISSYYPMITASWCYYGGPSSTGKVHYKLTGTAPNRVLTVEWKNIHTVNSTSYTGGTWQVRLYEGSNTIEFWYGTFTYASTYYFSVGIASSTSRYINVWGNNLVSQHYLYPSGSYYTYRYPNSYPINANTIFEFAPCDKNLRGLAGNISEGGTAKMESGKDELLVDKQVVRGNTEGYQPFSFELPVSPCEAWTYNITFSGPAAADYSVSPGNGTVITNGLAPTINFTPRGTGEREALMTIRVSNGQQFTYDLRAEGLSRMDLTGDVDEGGTTLMADGDKLLSNIDVPRGDRRDLHPFLIRNTNLAPNAKGLANAVVTFTLDDPYNQYALRLESGKGNDEKEAAAQAVTTTSIVLEPGGSVVPVITFAPNPQGTLRGAGPQVATLTVNADGEEYTYPVCAYSLAPIVTFSFNGELLGEGNNRLFVNSMGCVGEEATAGEFVVENMGKMPVVIESVEGLLTEHEIRQGAPPYPQMLKNGKVVPILDYFISENSAVAPYRANSFVEFPLTIQPGERRTYSLGFIAQRPEKRFGRMFIRSNAVNFTGKDVDAYMPGAEELAQQEEGILVLDLFGRGIGSRLASDADGGRKDLTVLFDQVRVAESTDAETWIHNTGDCDLRISKGDVRLAAGDVNEFQLLEILPNTSVDAQGDFILPPGSSDKIVARFTPSRSGSRRASVLLKTNDSTVVLDGITDRGVYYMDLFGVGKAFLEVGSVTLPPAVIGDVAVRGTVKAYNASTEPVVITAASLMGPDIAEIVADPAKWPALPLTLMPDEAVEFGVEFLPAVDGPSGERTAMLELTLRTGDVVMATIDAVAGTRTILANPSSLFTAASVPVGAVVREYATVTNTGTFPVRLNNIQVTGDGADAYTLYLAGRMTLAPGESMFMEITFQPVNSGPAAAQIEILSNAVGGAEYIALGGMAAGIGGEPAAASGAAEFAAGGQTLVKALATGRTAIGSIYPNPARDYVEVAYTVPTDGNVEIELYDNAGNMVLQLHDGYETSGAKKTGGDVSELANGAYLLVLKHGESITRTSVMILH